MPPKERCQQSAGRLPSPRSPQRTTPSLGVLRALRGRAAHARPAPPGRCASPGAEGCRHGSKGRVRPHGSGGFRGGGGARGEPRPLRPARIGCCAARGSRSGSHTNWCCASRLGARRDSGSSPAWRSGRLRAQRLSFVPAASRTFFREPEARRCMKISGWPLGSHHSSKAGSESCAT